jgi:DNA topoisomerase-3
MLEKARTAATERGLALPEAVAESYAACKAWLDEHVGSAPSSTQVAFARTLAERLGEALDPATLADSGTLSTWIDGALKRADKQAKARLTREAASEKQIALLQGAIAKGQIEAPANWPALNKLEASRLIDKVMSGGKSKPGGGRRGGGSRGRHG